MTQHCYISVHFFHPIPKAVSRVSVSLEILPKNTQLSSPEDLDTHFSSEQMTAAPWWGDRSFAQVDKSLKFLQNWHP